MSVNLEPQSARVPDHKTKGANDRAAVRDLGRAGEILAEHLGQSLAAHADGKSMTSEQIGRAQSALFAFHQLHYAYKHR